MFLLIILEALPQRAWLEISIHLMFLLIRYPIRSRWIRNIYFNTSHVSINRVMRGQTVQNYLHFNTSHVSINPSCNCGEYDRFYHFNTSHVSINPARSNGAAAGKKISIHLMFLLISGAAFYVCIKLEISIHLMFILISSFRMSSIGQPQISIHLMFILIKETCAQLDAFFGFQYISCLY